MLQYGDYENWQGWGYSASDECWVHNPNGDNGLCNQDVPTGLGKIVWNLSKMTKENRAEVKKYNADPYMNVGGRYVLKPGRHA